MSFQQKKRAMTPKGQMSGNGSGPAIMMMPPHVRATFMPNPPLRHLAPSIHWRRTINYITDDENATGSGVADEQANPPAGPFSGKTTISTTFPRLKIAAGLSGVSTFLKHFERTRPPERQINPTPKSLKEDKVNAKKAKNDAALAPLIEAYRQEQQSCSGEYTNGMNCYNSLFVGRLAYEVTERKLLREMEAYGPVKDLKLVMDKTTGKSRGFAFVEYEHEENMKRAYRAADGMRLEGRAIVVDVERGHTVPNWLPRKFGGGLGGTRLGGKDKNVFMAGRYDPSKQPPRNAMGPGPGMAGGIGMGPGSMNGRPPPGYGMGGRGDRGGPPPGYGDRGGGGYRYGGPPRGPPGPYGAGGAGYGPPPGYGERGGGGYRGGGPPRGPPGPHGGAGGGYGPPPLAWERDRGGGGYGDRKRRRSRSRSPDRRRGRY